MIERAARTLAVALVSLSVAALVGCSETMTTTEPASMRATDSPPPMTIVGCSPGYWKNHGKWPAPYSPSELFKDAGFVNAFGSKTLLQVLQTGGGGLNALGRQTVSALLNSAALAPWDKSPGDVISLFNAAYPNASKWGALQSEFEGLTDVNGRTCPLN